MLVIHVLSDLVAVLPLEFGQLSDHKARRVIIACRSKGGIVIELRGDNVASLGSRSSYKACWSLLMLLDRAKPFVFFHQIVFLNYVGHLLNLLELFLVQIV